MTDKTLKVDIRASDNASTVLAKIGDAAKTLGQSLEDAGKSADSLDQVTSSASKVGPAIESASKQGVSGFRSLADEVERLDSELSTAGKTLVGFGGVITGALAVPLTLGTKAAWDQVSAIEQATVALGAYETDARKVEEVLSELLAYARSPESGGLFWREELFAAAQNLRVMGAETDRLTEYVIIMSRAVGLGTANWEDLATVIGRVGSLGRLAGNEFDELTKMGFQLDESLRNTNITWDELFAALERGIPTGALENQMGTIQSLQLFLQGAIVEIGQAVLQVEKDTGRFIEGGLGDQLVGSISTFTETLHDLQPAASAFGRGVGTIVSGGLKLVETFNALPEPVQTFIAMSTGIVGATTLAAGSILLMISPVMRLGTALLTLGRSAAAMRLLAAATNPLTLGLTAAAAAGAFLWNSWREGEAAAKSLEDALKSLAETENELRLNRDDAAAESIRLFQMQSEYIAKHADEMATNTTKLIREAERRAAESGNSIAHEMALVGEAYTRTSEEAEAFSAAQTKIGAAFQDSRVDQAALGAALDALHEKYISGQITLDEYDDGVIEIANNLGDYRTAANDAAGATDNLNESATGLVATWKLLQSEGAGLLDTLLNLNTVTEDDSFADRLLKTLGLDASQRGQLDSVAETVRGINAELDDMPEPGATHGEWLDWINEEGISQAERTTRINAANEARREEERTTSMATIAEAAHTSALDAGNAAMDEHAARTEMALQIGESWNAHLEERNALIEENIARLQEAAGIDDPLSQWNLGENATAMSMLADATLDAATSLDTVFRVIVSNTDAIGNQVEGVEKWALELINVRGEYGLIDDLLAAGTITLQEYNAAQEAQETISAANLAIQEDILTIQARQAPLIADHTAALADQMDLIAVMPAQQQLIALGWMDATTAGRAMEFQTLAVAAAAGELGANGEEAFTSMITGAAQADPVLKALLVDMGLISEGANGEITVNLDGAEQAQSDLELLATTVADLIDLLDDGIMNASYQLKVDMETSVNGEPTGADGIAGVLQNLIGTVMGDDTGVEIPANISLPPDAAGLLQGQLSEQPVEAPVEPTLPPNASELLQQSLGGRSVEIEVAPVIKAGMDWLSDGIGALLGGDSGPQDTTVTIDAVDNASEVIDGITAQLTALGAWEPTVTIMGDGSHAQSVLDAYRGYDGVAIANPSVDILGDGANAQGVIDAYAGYDGVTLANPLVAILGEASNAQGVIDAYRGYDGVVLATSYIDIVTRTSTTDNNRHGGIPGYAHGGVLAELAEAGPEVLHFASGGTATVFDRGIYSVPPGTYVSPNNTYSTSYGAPMVNVNVTVQGSVMAEEDLADTITAKLAPALSEAMSVHYREQGMPW